MCKDCETNWQGTDEHITAKDKMLQAVQEYVRFLDDNVGYMPYLEREIVYGPRQKNKAIIEFYDRDGN